MKNAKIIATLFLAAIVSAGGYFLLAGRTWAHCDTIGGPVVTEAKAALEKGDVTPILKWVKKENEAEVRTAFAKAVAVRPKGPEAKELADRYFLETLVRLHRAGEGAPYTGLKDEPIDPIVALADMALAGGSAVEMIKKISDHMATAIGEKFNKALETKKNKDTSVEAGREFVEAYVAYMHYVEGIHAAIMSAGGHEHAGEGGSAGPATEERK
jgi:hypothetical protein